MVGSPVVKIAGIGLGWSEDYAEQYRRKLEEMGYSAKRVTQAPETSAYVVYCHRPFTHEELMSVWNGIFKQENEKES